MDWVPDCNCSLCHKKESAAEASSENYRLVTCDLCRSKKKQDKG